MPLYDVWLKATKDTVLNTLAVREEQLPMRVEKWGGWEVVGRIELPVPYFGARAPHGMETYLDVKPKIILHVRMAAAARLNGQWAVLDISTGGALRVTQWAGMVGQQAVQTHYQRRAFCVLPPLTLLHDLRNDPNVGPSDANYWEARWLWAVPGSLDLPIVMLGPTPHNLDEVPLDAFPASSKLQVHIDAALERGLGGLEHVSLMSRLRRRR